MLYYDRLITDDCPEAANEATVGGAKGVAIDCDKLSACIGDNYWCEAVAGPDLSQTPIAGGVGILWRAVLWSPAIRRPLYPQSRQVPGNMGGRKIYIAVEYAAA